MTRRNANAAGFFLFGELFWSLASGRFAANVALYGCFCRECKTAQSYNHDNHFWCWPWDCCIWHSDS
ncbi:hypothetical protein NECAME_00611 [Necator americanus]|uniref:Secreted protein n=1 Tax=Necator americanus TaxID=51031 RepID=W2SZM1_NECAM|nr:hypothetical protein NECAME_00611 [Necator americanus]ETN75200.1 hypothetical protein NECAME_00611 [Necator americanus]